MTCSLSSPWSRLRRSALLVLVATTAAAWSAQSADAQVHSRRADEAGFVGGKGSANFMLAERFAPYNVRDMVYSTAVSPRWIEGAEKFWYEWESSDGSRYYIVDPTRASKREIFDRDVLAAELTRITRDPWDGKHLPIENIRFISDDVLQFDVTSSQDEEVEDEEVEEDEQEEQEEQERRPARPDKKVHHFEFTISTQTLRELEDYEEPDDHPSWANVSPDGEWVVFARNHNLFMISGADYELILDARRGKSGDEAEEAEDEVEVEEIQLTEDGEKYYSWTANWSGRGINDPEKEEEWAKRNRANLSWSKDSRKFATVRTDAREVGELWVIHNTGHDRPELETYSYEMPGEEDVNQSELWVFDMESREMTQVDDDGWKDQGMSVVNDRQFFYADSEEPRRAVWITDGSDELVFLRNSRDRHRVDLVSVDLTTMAVTPLIEERLNTYQEWQPPYGLDDGSYVWWSERDGYAHLYHYSSDGRLLHRLTRGPFSVQGVSSVDEAAGVVYFTAYGREEGADPYYGNLYRVNLDGSGLQLLSEPNYDNRAQFSESSRYMVHSYSRVNTVPATVLRSGRGQVVMELEEADLSKLFEAGWQFPEPFTVKADDGVTDIYGVMYKPFDFDSTKVYPLVEYVYPGPQTESVSKFFSLNPYEVGLAQMGMVVVTLGNRGGHPDRSKWYHNYGYGNLRDYGLADKKAGAEQLAMRHSFIDLDRVGIYGHSGGGFMSTAAMLNYPDFFKVAVSSSGNHDNQVYNRYWSETHHGVKEVVDDEGNVSFEYDIDNNPSLARHLKGKLLLTTGDEDNNVHHANTVRMAHALIRANKRFDYFLFPGQRHGYGDMSDYWYWLRAEYFARHLLGDWRSHADIPELNNMRERN
jgi:dipeptidyl aminopeptidase/acylaminoacyl peptidase